MDCWKSVKELIFESWMLAIIVTLRCSFSVTPALTKEHKKHGLASLRSPLSHMLRQCMSPRGHSRAGDLPRHTQSSQLLAPWSHTTNRRLFPSVLQLLGATEGEAADESGSFWRFPKDSSSKWVLGESLRLPSSTWSYVPP